jgi:hypothetical protein
VRKIYGSNELGSSGENCIMKMDTVPPLDEVITSVVGVVK